MKFLKYPAFFAFVLLVFGSSLTAREQPAPNFRIRDINKQWIELSDLTKQGPVILDFWALWCIPCRKELPHLETLYRKYKERGLSVIAVNQDDMSSEAKVRPFVRSNRFTFPVIIDREKEIYRLYKVSSLPTLIIITRAGRVHSTHIGYRPGDEKVLEAEIRPLLLKKEIDESQK